MDVDVRTFEDETALMLACNSPHHQCVQLLLEGGACPNTKTKEDFTPLWFGNKLKHYFISEFHEDLL